MDIHVNKLVAVILTLSLTISPTLQQAQYCQPYSTSPNPSDPKLPKLPNQFHTIIEGNFLGRNLSISSYEYFDHATNQAAVFTMANGTLHRNIYDYKNNQLFYVHDQTCTVTDLTYDNNNVMFGDRVLNGSVRIFTTGGALHFAQSFGEKYMGKTTVRGISVNHWQSCIYWPQLSSNFTLDYYFTTADWLDPVIQPQIPVRAVASGTQLLGQGVYRNFTHFYDYVDFNLNITDFTVFETPVGVFCNGRKMVKPLPALPKYFHYKMEVHDITSSTSASKVPKTDVWYDGEHKLIRVDTAVSDQKKTPLKTSDPVKQIIDYNYGVSYYINRVTQKCLALPLSTNTSAGTVSHEFAPTGGGAHVIGMLSPDALFNLDNTSYAYTGQRTTRSLKCDVYQSYKTNVSILGLNNVQALYEFYFLADGYQIMPDFGSVTYKKAPVMLIITVSRGGVNLHQIHFNIDTEVPDFAAYDISPCYADSAKLQVLLRFSGHAQPSWVQILKQQAIINLSNASRVSHLRMQDVRVDYDDSFVYVYASILDRVSASAQFSHIPLRQIHLPPDIYYSYNLVSTASNCASKCVQYGGFTSQFSHIPLRQIHLPPDIFYSYNLVSTASDCASKCVQYGGFTCNSYDFCETDRGKTCRLFKTSYARNSSYVLPGTCDHYTRTVVAPAHPEIDVTNAYNNLTARIYSGQLFLLIFLETQIQPITFTAVDISVISGRLYDQSLPNLEVQFSYHLENSIPNIQQVFNSHIYYDYLYKLVRYDLVNGIPLTYIHDYNSGLSYTIDRQTQLCTVGAITNSSFDVLAPSSSQVNKTGYMLQMRNPLQLFDPTNNLSMVYQRGLSYTIDRQTQLCTVGAITNSSFDVLAPSSSQVNKTGYMLQMRNPLQLFDLTNNFVYVGQKTIRNMMCDMYENVGKFNFGGTKKDAVFQFFFMSTGWHELSSDSGKPVPNQPVSLIVSATDGSELEHYDIYDFNQQPPDLTNFDIQTCFPDNKKSHFVIFFNQTYHPTLDIYLAQFQKNVQKQLSVNSGVSPLRFQNPVVNYYRNVTFYMATMVEQAPALFDFTKTSNSVGLYSSDASFPGVTSDAQCAGLCRNMTGLGQKGFACFSFDYCPSKQLCQLSHQRTPDGKKLKGSTTCDHYSKTVAGKLNIEPTVEQAFTMFLDQISRGTLVVNVQVNASLVVKYPAYNLDRNILRFDSGKPTSDTLAHFSLFKKKYAYLHPNRRVAKVSVDECAGRCMTEISFECKSFAYCFERGVCMLSDTHPGINNTAAEAVTLPCDLYARRYADAYVPYPGKVLPSVNDVLTPNVASPDICAKQCSTYTQFTCRSFDFCPTSGKCYLKRIHALDYNARLVTSSTCSHFSKKFLYDFIRTPKRALFTGTTIKFFNVSGENCAKLCVENSGMLCRAFTFCGETSECTIVSSQTNLVQSQIKPSYGCDLYTRQYFPNQSNTPSKPPSSQQQSSGFSPGAMGGVAGAMLIVGGFLGAALLYFIRTRKLEERKVNYEMQVVKRQKLNDS